MTVLLMLLVASVQGAIVDTYEETFDDEADEATIDGVDNWSVDQGAATDAITQNDATYTGSGKSLQLTGAETAANVSRTATYGEASPCWVEFKIRPALGGQTQTIPSGKIAAVTFDHKGKIYASDGSSWTDTGATFSADEWYTVVMKLDFGSHLYDIYIEPTASPEAEFIPDKENLNFIDSSISYINKLGFDGVYSATQSSDETYIDDLIVHFIDRIEIISAQQTLAVDQPSSPITAQLQNSYSEPQTAWEDIQLELRSTSDGGEFSLDRDNWSAVSVVTLPENAWQIIFYYKDTKRGKPIITVNEYPDSGWEEASQQSEIVAEASYFDVSCVTPQTAGEYFNISITAKDEDGEVNKFYSGEIEILADYIAPLGGTRLLEPQTASGFNDGLLNLGVMYPDCGTIEIVVREKEEPSKTGHSGQVLFKPANFTVSAGSPQVVTRGFPLLVTVYNALGGITPNYIGPAGLTAIAVSPEEVSGGIVTPRFLGEGDFVNGVANASVSYNRWGRIKVEVHDASYPDRKGTSGEIAFMPAAVKIEVAPPGSGRAFYYTGEEIEVVLSVVDDAGEAIPNYTGFVAITPTMGLDIAAGYQYLIEDGGSRSFLAGADEAGIYKIDVEEQSGLRAQSEEIEVKQATLEVIDTTAPAGSTTEVYIRIVDDEGNIIRDSDLTATVHIEEEVPNSSCISAAFYQPLDFTDGMAKMWISDTEAEIVTINPKSKYKFKVKKGTVTFGRVAKSGVGTLLWREIKE